MKASKIKKITVSVLIILLFLSVQYGFGEAPPEEGSWYGDKGTLEIGFSGSITLPTEYKFSGTGAPPDGDDGTTTIMLSPFVNYFFMNGFHAGARVIYMSMKTDTETYESEMTLLFLYPSAGYALAIMPNLQLDLSVNLGYMSMTMDDWDTSSFSYGFSAMALFPVSENALFGIGVMIAWYNPEMEGVDYTATYRSTQIPIQMSIYF